MPGRRANQSSLGVLVILVLVAFALGRCSASKPDALVAQSIATVPTSTPGPGGRDLPQSLLSEVERAGEEPAVQTEETEAEIYYPNCTAARAAGATPIHEGEPGYASKLDRDDDGVACE